MREQPKRISPTPSVAEATCGIRVRPKTVLRTASEMADTKAPARDAPSSQLVARRVIQLPMTETLWPQN